MVAGELADRAGLSCDTIRNIESAKRSATLGVLAKVARGLQLDLVTLWRGIEAAGEPQIGLDGLTEAERDLVTAFVRVLAERRAQTRVL